MGSQTETALSANNTKMAIPRRPKAIRLFLDARHYHQEINRQEDLSCSGVLCVIYY